MPAGGVVTVRWWVRTYEVVRESDLAWTILAEVWAQTRADGPMGPVYSDRLVDVRVMVADEMNDGLEPA